MSRDNWERLVVAVIRRDQIWQLCHQDSITTVSSDLSQRVLSNSWSHVSSSPSPQLPLTSHSVVKVQRIDVEVAAAILQVLAQNLIGHSKKEISLIGGLDKDAKKLTGSLDTIQKFLNDAEMQTIPSEAVKSWLKRLEVVLFDADYILDELNYHLLSKKIMKIKKIKVPSCFPSFNHIARQRKVALRIKGIYENLESINKEATKLGLPDISPMYWRNGEKSN